MTDYMVEGLIKRRAKIAGELLATQDSMAEMARDLETLGAALKLVAPDLAIAAMAPKMVKPPADWSKRGEMSRQCSRSCRQRTSCLRPARSPVR